MDPPTREPFLLKVFFGGRLDGDEFAAILDERIAEGEAQFDAFRRIVTDVADGLGDRPPSLDQWLRLATLENGIRHLLTEIDWLRELKPEVLHPSAAIPQAWRELRNGSP